MSTTARFSESRKTRFFVTEVNLIPCTDDSDTDDPFEDQEATIREAKGLPS